MARYIGQWYEAIVQDFARDTLFTAADALRYGFIDAIAGADVDDDSEAAPKGVVAA